MASGSRIARSQRLAGGAGAAYCGQARERRKCQGGAGDGDWRPEYQSAGQIQLSTRL